PPSVPSHSSPGRTIGSMRWAGMQRPRDVPPGGAETRGGYLLDSAELAAELLDVLRVEVDRFLKWLQTLLHVGVVALVALADAFLLCELLLSVRKQLLFVLELRF